MQAASAWRAGRHSSASRVRRALRLSVAVKLIQIRQQRATLKKETSHSNVSRWQITIFRRAGNTRAENCNGRRCIFPATNMARIDGRLCFSWCPQRNPKVTEEYYKYRGCLERRWVMVHKTQLTLTRPPEVEWTLVRDGCGTQSHPFWSF